MKVAVSLVVAATGAFATAVLPRASSPGGKGTCKDVVFSVSGSAQNRDLSGVNITALSLDALTALITATGYATTFVSGTQKIAGTYCTPNVKNANNDKLEVFFGSITANRDNWSALGGTSLGFPAYRPEQYSWVDFALGKGYPTLQLDKLGEGKSSRPDPILVTQGPYEFQLYHDLNRQIRSSNAVLGRTYSYLIYVGNSYGSVVGNNLAQLFPTDWNTFVLTGFSKSVLPSLPGVTLQGPLPGAVVFPTRFAGVPLGYLTAPVAQTKANSFFGSHAQSSFEDYVTQIFWQREDVVSVGDFISTYSLIRTSPAYTGRVLVLTGEQDQAFCGPGSSAIGPASCGPLLKDTGALFPNADYNYQSVNSTGHAIQLHLTSQKTYTIAHNFLAGQTYRGNPPA